MRISKLKSQNVKIKYVCVLNALDITIKTLRSIFSLLPPIIQAGMALTYDPAAAIQNG